MYRAMCVVVVAGLALAWSSGVANGAEDGWVTLFDGKSLDGWKATVEGEGSWKVEDGAIVANAKPRSHLFYVGDDKPFVNFELQLDVMTEPNSNGGVYFHTKYQPEGWPKEGYEVQVNNTHRDPRKTGSLYAVKDVHEAPAEDKKWFTMYIKVQGKTVTTKVDGKTLVEFTEEEGRQPGKDFTRILSSGTFALQGHDPDSTVRFKNIKVKRLE